MEQKKGVILNRVKQQIYRLESEGKQSKYKKYPINYNILQQEKQQLEEEIRNITVKLQSNRLKIIDWQKDRQDFEQKWNEIQVEEIQSFEERMQTLLNEEQEPLEQLTREVEELLCFKEEPQGLYVIEEEQSFDSLNLIQ